ncbi:MAG: selenocysteine-specific translation elongation factor [Pyrinomonadaceae bacterium]
MNIIVGTAGHIDHGKTALIKALTGTDTDRLPEEKKRGITIDLGFAELELGGHRIGFVDVPGHERFVKNMLAGASGIDLVLLIIAADEGVMPQTREHFDICRLLGVQNGLIVLTKNDLVDEELLDLVRLEAAELAKGSFLENAPVVLASSKTGVGIDALKQAIVEAAGRIGEREDSLSTRLPIDRSFVVRGFGTVVTGTLASGTIREADEMTLMPAGKKVRVRGLQTHGKEVKTAQAGQRVAVNLAGKDQAEIERGMVLCESGALGTVQIFNARVEVLASAAKALRSRQRVRVHVGTAEVLARVHIINDAGEISPGDTDLAQFRLELPVVAIPGERFIARSYSPQMTIAGGTIVDTFPKKQRKRDLEDSRDHLHRLIGTDGDRTAIISLVIEAAGEQGIKIDGLQARTGWKKTVIEKAIDDGGERSVDAGGVYLASKHFDRLKEKTLDAVSEHHKRQPLSDGLLRAALVNKVFAHKPADILTAVIARLESERLISCQHDLVRSFSHSQKFTDEEAKVIAGLREIFTAADLAVPKLDEALGRAITGTKLTTDHARKLVQVLVNSGELVKVTNEFYFASAAIKRLVEKLRAYADTTVDRSIDVPKFKDIAGVSRKYAIPLLEYFDSERMTVRSGDRRVIL